MRPRPRVCCSRRRRGRCFPARNSWNLPPRQGGSATAALRCCQSHSQATRRPARLSVASAFTSQSASEATRTPWSPWLARSLEVALVPLFHRDGLKSLNAPEELLALAEQVSRAAMAEIAQLSLH
jgi:hypothetical protein